MKGRVRKFGAGMRDGSGYAAGVRLGQAKTAKWLRRATGGRCEDDLDDVEGGKARQRLDRPGRKHGGKVAKHDNDHDEDDGYAKGGKIRTKRGMGGLLGGGMGGMKSKLDEEDPEAQGKVQNAAAKVASLGMLKRGGKVKKG